MTDQSVGTSYDVVPYDSYAFHETHPEHLAVVCRLHGLRVPDPATCRVLEIGCASGGNLIPMGVSLPGATLVGVDLSRGQVEEGRRQIKAIGLKNVTLVEGDVGRMGGELGEFDYIIAHGVFSWIPREARESLLNLCAKQLTPDGVAYVSYNAYPGWHPLSMLRQMMLFHARRFEAEGLQRQVAEVRSLLRGLVEGMPDRETPYAISMRVEVEGILRRSDSYILHEYLERENQPYLLTEFCELARRHGLRYVADARLRSGVGGQSPEVQKLLEGLAGEEPRLREQYLDFLRNRTFRRSLLVHEKREPAGEVQVESLRELRFQTLALPVNGDADPYSKGAVEYGTPDGRQRLATNHPMVKMAFLVLRDAWPGTLGFEDLRIRIKDQLARSPGRASTEAVEVKAEELAEAMRSCLLNGMIDMRTGDPPFGPIVGERPVGSPYARFQAETGNRVTNLIMRAVDLTAFERLVLLQLDGTRDRAGILEELVTAALEGRFPMTHEGAPLNDAIQIRAILSRSLEPCLQRLAATGLVMV